MFTSKVSQSDLLIGTEKNTKWPTHPQPQEKQLGEPKFKYTALRCLLLMNFPQLIKAQNRRGQYSIPALTREPQTEKNICSVGTSHISNPEPGTLHLGVCLTVNT